MGGGVAIPCPPCIEAPAHPTQVHASGGHYPPPPPPSSSTVCSTCYIILDLRLHRWGLADLLGSGLRNADPLGTGITRYLDGNAAERVSSDFYLEKQTFLRKAKSS